MKKLFDKFARYYDFIYADKDYRKECDFIEAIIRTYLMSSSPMRILDIGCGSGGHAVILARRGYRMTGIDISETMISMAREKSPELDINFQLMDMAKFSLEEKFDVCTCLFCGMCYLLGSDTFENALKCVRESLLPGGLFIFDFWNGIAVTSQEPSTRVKDVKYGNHSRIIRIAEPELNLTNQVCDIKYHCLVIEKEKLVDEFEETHPIRYFFPREIEWHLKNNGYKSVKICSFLNYDLELEPDSWCLTAIAEAG